MSVQFTVKQPQFTDEDMQKMSDMLHSMSHLLALRDSYISDDPIECEAAVQMGIRLLEAQYWYTRLVTIQRSRVGDGQSPILHN